MKKDSKWALVTGASSGFGIDFSNQLAERGYNLILTARRVDRLQAQKKHLETTYGVKAEVIASDLAQADAPAQLHRQIQAQGIAVDVLINNAGYGVFGEFAGTEWEKTSAMLQVDIVALTHLTKLFADDMKKRGSGHILLISSIGAYQATPTYAAYSAAKAYVLSFGEAIHAELKPFGVNVSVLSPGVTATEFLERAGQRPTLYQRAVMMKSAPVARIGLKAMFGGVPSVLPGLINKLTVFSLRFAPRKLQAKMAYLLMRN